MPEVNDFNAVRISLASPEQIRGWSYGEVLVPETLNYRTLKPEKDGLFSERIFGPTKDFECYCGKYKKIRYKGVICDKCGVEVARAKVRRERMGHIELAAPVAHIWFSRGTPSRLGLLLDLSPRALERVLYFAQYIVTSVHDDKRKKAIHDLKGETPKKIAELEEKTKEEVSLVRQNLGKLKAEEKEQAVQARESLERRLEDEKEQLERETEVRIEEIEDLSLMTPLPESKYRELKEKYDFFEAQMGAEAILDILKKWDLDELRSQLLGEIQSSSGQRRKKAAKRLRVVEAFRRSGNKPEWMVITVLPVLPPDLRPMVQLDGGRFATSDLNDLYRRVINRNNRLKRLLELGAPEVIIRNEKRMLQEAVDALVDNSRRNQPMAGGARHRLKSLSDMLRGKQGRFRQNLLGKRVDYSGRSVIVVGPELQLYQCGLPRRMSLELFKPFVMRRLIEGGLAHNIKSARRLVERARPEVWDILEEVVKERPVLLNRAPTLHRLGIQAFEPALIDGSAIQLHPLVCAAFNADFDGDQMAVHVPLSRKAVEEARKIMLSINNMLLPSSGEPVVAPTLDIVLGCYYLTQEKKGARGEGSTFTGFDEALMAHELGEVAVGARIKVRDREGQILDTTIGQVLFNSVLPPQIGFINRQVDKPFLKGLVARCYQLLGNEATAQMLDNLKHLGFHYATQSGITIAMDDIKVPLEKPHILAKGDERISQIERQYQMGLITEEERYTKVVDTWTEITEGFKDLIQQGLDRYGGVYMMATSGAKGNISQIMQMAGMRGLMTDPSGRIIDFPIRSSFREGLTVLEYFISTHGARKGLADTALRTSDSGYLTRRLVDVAQDVIITGKDCGTTQGIWISEPEEKGLLQPLARRIVGRMAAAPVEDPRTHQVIVERNEEITEEKASAIEEAGVTRVYVRSPLACPSRKGACQMCYGRDLARGRLVDIGTAVGIIAAQSIGEPGTQLTMRTFHTGGVVGLDITSGLPRVEELFEARAPKGQAIISEIDGVVEVLEGPEGRRIKVTSTELHRDEYPLPTGAELLVSQGQKVEAGTPLALPSPKEKGENHLLARRSGEIAIEKDELFIYYEENDVRDYLVPGNARIRLTSGQPVRAGQQLTDGPTNPQDMLRIMGKEAVQRYLVNEVQKVYCSQGVDINDKHIETISRQMLTKVKVETSGDTDLLPGELVDRFAYEDTNAKILAEGGEPATAQPVLLGITRASLNTESWLAAASFQETTRVLTEAAIWGKVDRLVGLKENVIIGKLIPAQTLIEEAETSPTLAAEKALKGGEET